MVFCTASVAAAGAARAGRFIRFAWIVGSKLYRMSEPSESKSFSLDKLTKNYVSRLREAELERFASDCQCVLIFTDP
jgi:hypothetical protein